MKEIAASDTTSRNHRDGLMRAVEQMTTGNFLCMPDGSQVVVAVISQCSKGWRVFSNVRGKRCGRTFSETPEQAARKYFRDPVTFVRLTAVREKQKQ